MVRPLPSPSPLFLVVLLAAPAVLAGCLGGGPTKGANVLRDPGFEAGADSWFWLETSNNWLGPYEVAPEGRSGNASLRLELRDDPRRTVGIMGAVQNLSFAEVGRDVPRRLTGHYRVDHWDAGAQKTYVQVVLGLFPRPGSPVPVCPFPVQGPEAAGAPCQLAYVLGGIDREPFAIGNRKFLFLGDREVTPGGWVSFEASPRADFERAWGQRPMGFTHLWIYLEARYEYGQDETRRPVHAVVRWDDLHLG